MIKHEQNCGLNPINWRACSMCDFLKRKPVSYYYDTYEGEHEGSANGFYCDYLNAYMYPPFIEDKPFFTNNPEQFEEQTPFKRQCEKCTICGTCYGLDHKYVADHD